MPKFGQTRRPFKTAAYQYIRESDNLPTIANTPDPNPMCLVKLFNPSGIGTWYIAGIDPDGTAFGIVTLFETELGYFDINELIALRTPPFGLPIERDLHWTPAKTTTIMERERKLPVCFKCGQAIRKSEYLDDGREQRHIVCPAPRAR